MLTTRERTRLREAMPSQYPAQFVIDGETRQTTIEPEFLWTGADDEDETTGDYPVILLGWDQRGNAVENEDTVNDFVSRQYDDSYDGSQLPDDRVFRERRSEKQVDELQVTPVVETEWVDGVPPQTRGEAMARQLWKWGRFRATGVLNEVGPNDERPMVFEASSSPTPSRAGDTYRLPFTLTIRHTEAVEDVVPIVQDEQINTETSTDT
jgi:hypothetical protein